MNQQIAELLRCALESSVLLNPLSPGLTVGELLEVGRRAGYLDGEIGDALRTVGRQFFGSTMVQLSESEWARWGALWKEDPDFRNLDALDFVVQSLNDLTRSVGANCATIDRTTLVAQAITVGILERDVQGAITWLVGADRMVEKNGAVSFKYPAIQDLPGTRLRNDQGPVFPKPARKLAHPIVEDLIARRTDGRPVQAEPLKAFGAKLQELGYGNFRMWWDQTVSELNHLNPQLCATSATLLSAALVEGALIFIVRRGQTVGLFGSSDYEAAPNRWRIEKLIASAASGGPNAILEDSLRRRAEHLTNTRQRIHAGRMLSDFPQGAPDIKPEQARDAKATAEAVVRAILDWLQTIPAAGERE